MTVGIGPPDEVQEMLTLLPSAIITVALVPAAVLGDAKCLKCSNSIIIICTTKIIT